MFSIIAYTSASETVWDLGRRGAAQGPGISSSSSDSHVRIRSIEGRIFADVAFADVAFAGVAFADVDFADVDFDRITKEGDT